jgi:hypothetical protein
MEEEVALMRYVKLLLKKTLFSSEFIFFLLWSIIDKGIGELKANPRWVD